MKKYWKWIIAIAAMAAAIGAAVAYFLKKSCDGGSEDDGDDEFEEEEELDEDLKPASEREYVPLNKTAEDTKKADDTPTEEENEDSQES